MITLAALIAISGVLLADSGAIRFSHKNHPGPCVDCHKEILTAKTLVIKDHLPKMKTCGSCHDIENKEQCDRCHKFLKAGYQAQEKTYNFFHYNHPKPDCVTCHGTMESGKKRMMHKDCEECHQDDIKKMRCIKCHRKFGTPDIEALSGYRHSMGYVDRHGDDARLESRTCVQCHDASFCYDCHAKRKGLPKIEVKFPEKLRSAFIHRGDYITRHMYDLKQEPGKCQRCHGQTFCQDCHARSGLTVSPKTSFSGHPAGWLDSSSPNFHSKEARRNIFECASCHSGGADSLCIKCHREGGADPHPPGFKGKLNSQLSTFHDNPKMCLNCHTRKRLCSYCH